MAILLFFAFLSGLVTIAAPCIWPLLPIVLSASIVGNDHRRPLGVTTGILVSFGALTLTISYLVSIFKFNPDILRFLAVIILVVLGFSMVIPTISRIVEGFVSRLAGRFGGSNNRQADFIHGFITGLSLGIVWTPCAGPILAAIATLAATRSVNFEIFLVTIVYLIGVGIPLFLFAYAGQRFAQKSRSLSRYTGHIQRIFGVIIILTAVLIFTGYDKVIQAKLLDAFPAYSKFIVDLENNDAVKGELDKIRGKDDMVGKPYNPMDSSDKTSSIFNANVKAPEITGINNWLNLPSGKQSLSIAELKGKVVLVDFWTYTCINCIRTLPHIVSWYEKYKDDGFVVLGIHTPEFEFEKNTNNVLQATKQYKITYPVAQDNDYATWEAYDNHYWPAKYLIDRDGSIRYYHFGEGEYEKTEEAIQLLLEEAGQKVTDEKSNMPDETPKIRNSPETYLGASRMEYYYPNGRINIGSYNNLKTSSGIPTNSFTLGGNWIVSEEYSESGSNAVLEYKFFASKVFLVMKPRSTSSGQARTEGKVKVILDGKEVGFIPINSDKLYDLINLQGNPGEHLLRLEFSPGIQVFAFTFG